MNFSIDTSFFTQIPDQVNNFDMIQQNLHSLCESQRLMGWGVLILTLYVAYLAYVINKHIKQSKGGVV